MTPGATPDGEPPDSEPAGESEAERDRQDGLPQDEQKSAQLSHDERLRRLLDLGALARDRAAADRARAAADRARAAADRERAAIERRRARLELQRLRLEGQGGAPVVQPGELSFLLEIERCHRSGTPFVLGLVDVDAVPSAASPESRAGSAALLRAVADVLSSELPAHDPIMQVRRDAFLCGFVSTKMHDSRLRVLRIQDALATHAPGGSVTVGLAALRAHDTLSTLTQRAGVDLAEHRRGA